MYTFGPKVYIIYEIIGQANLQINKILKSDKKQKTKENCADKKNISPGDIR